MLLLLASAAAAAGEAAIRELLEQALARPGETVRAELDGLLAAEIMALHPQLRVYGEAELLRPLPEPGCGHMVLRLHAVDGDERIEFGAAELDLCEGGLPPGPPPGLR